MVDLDQTRAFLEHLGGESFHFQTFDDSEKKSKSLVWTGYGTLEEYAAGLQRYNESGAGIFVTINESDGVARTAAHMQRVRANFLDLDGAELPESWELEPHLIVESSPGKYHIYWLVLDEPLDAFKSVQRAIARRYKGDPKVSDLPRVMRLPGFLHKKGEPAMVRIIEAAGQLVEPYTFEAIQNAFSVKPEPSPATLQVSDSSVIPAGQRNETLFSMASSMRAKGWCDQAIRSALLTANAYQCEPRLEEGEVEALWKSALRYDQGELPAPQAIAEAAEVDSFELLSVAEIKKRRTIAYTVQGILEHGRYSQVFGEPGSGKTFWVLDVGLHVAAGREYYGRKVRQGPVIYVCGEGSAGIGRRVRAWEIQNGLEMDAAPFFVSSHSVPLLDEDWCKRLYQEIDSTCKSAGYEYPSLVIIDTVARNFGPGDENSTQDMQTFISHVDRWLGAQLNCTILQVHHTGHQNKDRARGSSALFGALDVEYRVERGEDGLMRVYNTKVKDMEPPVPMAFKVHEVNTDWADDEGVALSSLALSEIPWQENEIAERKGGLPSRHQEIADLATQLIQRFEHNLEVQGRQISDAKLEVNVLRDEVYEAGILGENLTRDARRKAWRRAFEKLINTGVLHIENGFVKMGKA